MKRFSTKAFVAGMLLVPATAIPAGAQTYSTSAPPQTMAAGSIGGSWYVLATALFDLFEQEIEGLQYNTTPGGGVANPIAVQQGQATIALSYTTNLFAAYNGDEPYEEAMEDIRGVVNMNSSAALHPWVLSELDVSTLGELAEQQIGVSIDTGPRGTGGELSASRALELHGMGYDQIREWGGSITHSNYREALDRMRDGHINMFMNDDYIGAVNFTELTSARNVTLLSQEDDAIEQMSSRYGYDPVTIPAGTYDGQDSDINTTEQHNVIFAHKDVDEDLIYAMVSLIFDNTDHLGSVHNLFTNLDPEVGPQGFPIPLHPGAERYYREHGLID
jgi:uncharacterized protein